MPLEPDANEIFDRIAQTIAWCQPRASLTDPKNCLRSVALRPSHLSETPNEPGNYDYLWRTPDENRNVVTELALKRAELLQTEVRNANVLPSDLAGGRLLIMAPEESDWCGLSEAETDGFIDILDVPAWDTWVGYFHEATTPEPDRVSKEREERRAYFARYNYEHDWQPPATVSYLLCWIPPQFLDSVEMGIMVNPVRCLFWASNYRDHHFITPHLQQLDAAKLLW